MSDGYIYILINNSMPGLIKIGKTRRDVRQRAKELSNTSTPTPFIVAFEMFVNEVDQLEKYAHTTLVDYRINPNREFFRYPLSDAINMIIEKVSTNDFEEEYSAVDIYDALLISYPKYMSTDFVAVKIVQTFDRVWLETTTEDFAAGYLKDQTIHRMDLGFISDDCETNYFDSKDTVARNAEKFVNELGAYSIAMTTDLFDKESEKEIFK